MRKVVQNEKGLTLVELLATLVILAIIATIAVLSIGQIIKNSEQRAIVADAVQLIEAAKLAEANGDIPEPADTYTLASLKEYLSGTSKKLTENLGATPSVKMTDDATTKLRTYEVTGVAGKIAELKKKTTSKYSPASYKEEDLKKALEGKGQGSK